MGIIVPHCTTLPIPGCPIPHTPLPAQPIHPVTYRYIHPWCFGSSYGIVVSVRMLSVMLDTRVFLYPVCAVNLSASQHRTQSCCHCCRCRSCRSSTGHASSSGPLLGWLVTWPVRDKDQPVIIQSSGWMWEVNRIGPQPPSHWGRGVGGGGGGGGGVHKYCNRVKPRKCDPDKSVHIIYRHISEVFSWCKRHE